MLQWEQNERLEISTEILHIFPYCSGGCFFIDFDMSVISDFSSIDLEIFDSLISEFMVEGALVDEPAIAECQCPYTPKLDLLLNLVYVRESCAELHDRGAMLSNHAERMHQI